MTIYWNADAAARAGLTSEDMLRLSAASEQSAQPGRELTQGSAATRYEIVHSRLLIRQIVERYPALFVLQRDE